MKTIAFNLFLNYLINQTFLLLTKLFSPRYLRFTIIYIEDNSVTVTVFINGIILLLFKI